MNLLCLFFFISCFSGPNLVLITNHQLLQLQLQLHYDHVIRKKKNVQSFYFIHWLPVHEILLGLRLACLPSLYSAY
ncbi:hypothetical protein BO71DRAFT_223039 [Aspergillus ellipticus CBS 707.79]|uniref:Secreted protein n=1 Tax=Aspergillus ellipticus CBS 707.79 TaxID=1448320 RepID=A0A319F3A3_9EURO|nr:hypothetical protein BO71DRAFT_223039 [Aspergillus ellipticus CBS 707.79]